MNIAVLGDGAWGSAIAHLLSTNKHSVTLWGPFPDYISEMRKCHSNPHFLPKIRFSDNMIFSADLKETVTKSEILVLALPSQYIRKLLENIQPFFDSDKHILVDLAKGIEIHTLKRISEIVSEILGESNYAVLSGPSHAEEVIMNVPTAVVVASEKSHVGKIVQNAFMNPAFRVYCSSDPVGVELGGALKNVFAIAAGFVDGIGLGDNSKAALLTRSIAEISRLGKALGGNIETFSGLSGIGDLIVTCYSKHSRNRFVGEKLGSGYKLNEILKELNMAVAEGVKTTESAYQLAKKTNVETPIIGELYAALYEDKDPKKCIRDLMTRTATTEIYP
jgi:glycerol-3-phosphate dehydrogenase (NAD(P)+)